MIEVMIIVAILGLLAAIIVSSYVKAKQQSRHGRSSGVTYYGGAVEIYIDGNKVEAKKLRLEITTK